MKEPYDEGIAHHIGPESWGGYREVPAKALTGETASLVLSREISYVGDADAVPQGRRQQRVSQHSARLAVSSAVLDLVRAAKPTTRNPGEPVAPQADGCLGRVGKPQGVIR